MIKVCVDKEIEVFEKLIRSIDLRSKERFVYDVVDDKTFDYHMLLYNNFYEKVIESKFQTAYWVFIEKSLFYRHNIIEWVYVEAGEDQNKFVTDMINMDFCGKEFLRNVFLSIAFSSWNCYWGYKRYVVNSWPSVFSLRLNYVCCLHKEKAYKYGSSWCKYGWESIFQNLARKIDRLKNYFDNIPEEELATLLDDSFSDSFLDLFVYCLKAITYLDISVNKMPHREEKVKKVCFDA
ncbi:MAG: hypothetical protein GF317_04955 [Candidatus Lokiarchaeota archaeon]|nr:hypothetical protein [Candidatus Lokiarchaeota archaeon]